MHLVFHAGLHKTGTKTFQHVVASLQAELRAGDIHVPVVGGTANMGYAVVHPAQRGDWSGYEAILDEAKAVVTPGGILLVSAEDLENCLFDMAFGRQFMIRARAKGIASIRWVFVLRNEFEYFESLYGELSRHRQVLRYDLMAHEILDHGFVTCATPRFRWYFVFRYEAALRRFRNRVCGDASSLTFAEFTRDGIGATLFGLCGKADVYSSLGARVAAEPRNRRPTDEEVERAYVATFLGLGDSAAGSAEPSPALEPLVARRLESRSLCRPGIMRRFERELGAIPPSPPAPAPS